MDAIKSYIFSLTGFSFISSLALSLLPDIPAKRTVKFICGIILSLLILSPIKNMNVDFSDIFETPPSYNSYNDNTEITEYTRKVISDKVKETVEICFEKYEIWDAKSEVIFDDSGNILLVKIDTYNEKAARDAADILGIPYEIIKMTE